MIVKKLGVFRKTETKASHKVYRDYEMQTDEVTVRHNELVATADTTEGAELEIDNDIINLAENFSDNTYAYGNEEFDLSNENDLRKLKAEVYFVSVIYVWSPD